MKYYNPEGTIRQESLRRLSVFIQNPGRFSLLVLGGRGTGKKSAIQWAYNEAKAQRDDVEDLCMKGDQPTFVSASEMPQTSEELVQLLAENKHKTLVVADIEKIGQRQELLFEAMSTTDGKFGFGDKTFAVRVVFTSSLPADQLRSDQTLLSGKFWDRISQLSVRMPSYLDEPNNIIKDFNSTWDKMEFFKISPEWLSARPKNTKLQMWLEDGASRFEGGFRDLDKIVVLYFNYRLFHYSDSKRILEGVENKVVKDVREDFGTIQLNKEEYDGLSVFRMDSESSWSELEDAFRDQFYRWAKAKYKTMSQIKRNLDISISTFKDQKRERIQARRARKKA